MARPNRNIPPETQKLMSDRLKEIRNASGLSQKQFAAKITYQQQDISRIECGISPMTTGLANAIAQNFPVRAAYLLCWDDCKTDADYQCDSLIKMSNLSVTEIFEVLLRKSGYPDCLASPEIIQDVLDYLEFKVESAQKNHTSQNSTGSKLKEVMNKTNSTYKQLADLTGMDIGSLRNIAAGQRNISKKLARCIHEAYPEISLSWLLAVEGETE